MDTLPIRKARGAFFTPPEISRYVVDWAVRSKTDVILEPSCGEASFLVEAGEALRRFGKSSLFFSDQLHGVEIHGESAAQARNILSASNLDAHIRVSDFFDCSVKTEYDAVIGNPPYVRYQQHAGTARTKSLEAALAQGVRLNGLASSWAAFAVQAASFLKKEGRLGLVLPAELLSVNYAAPVRRFLLERFGRVRLVMFENRVFPGVLEEVVLLLAEGSGGANCFEVHQARDLAGLAKIESSQWQEHRPDDGAKWTPALLSSSLFEVYRDISEADGFETLVDWGDTYLGAVTGNNGFFCLRQDEVKSIGLREGELLRISPPGSRHLRGRRFTESAWQSMVNEGARCFLFRPKDKPSIAALRYIAEGEAKEVHATYKCAARTPWYQVPLVQVPDLFLTYMNHDRPRLVTNDAQAQILNSLYGVLLHHGRKAIGRDLLPIACLNSLTLLGSEMVGRAYGGGLLKLEPKEADKLPVPSKALLESVRDELEPLVPQVFNLLRGDGLSRVVEMVDRVILSKALKVSDSDIAALSRGRELLLQRRVARGKAFRDEG
ncbi:MAG: N-6 DNA methylase [Reyranella sp.]|nr:N-6 DNA methylase [Reyranella sp.]